MMFCAVLSFPPVVWGGILNLIIQSLCHLYVGLQNVYHCGGKPILSFAFSVLGKSAFLPTLSTDELS